LTLTSGHGEAARVETGTLVLLSGGIDSSATLAVYRRRPLPVSALFVEYGQAAAEPELAAARRVAEHHAVDLRIVRCSGLGTFDAGYVRGRNAMLLHLALTAAPFDSGQIAIGIHAGTPYGDCSPLFVMQMQRAYDLYCDGRIQIVAPFIENDKQSIIAFCREAELPLGMTYSCERGCAPPCGACTSCIYRGSIDVR
jgi:7-cyano-7-deazaguanine synthase